MERIQQIDEAADEARKQLREKQDAFDGTEALSATYNSLTELKHQSVHDRLNHLVQFHRKLKEDYEQLQGVPIPECDTGALDAVLQAHLRPSLQLTSTSHSLNGASSRTLSESTLSRPITPTRERSFVDEPASSWTAPKPTIPQPTTLTQERSLSDEHASSRPTTPTSERFLPTEDSSSRPMTPTRERSLPEDHSERPNHTPVAPNLMNSATTNHTMSNGTTDNNEHDEFDAGLTARIQRQQVIFIAANNDGYTGTVCCHDDELLYIDHDERSRTSEIIMIDNINEPNAKRTIDWKPPASSNDTAIRDIIYSEKLGTYVLLNVTGLYTLSRDTKNLEEFYSLPDRKWKRICCDSNYLYLISPANQMPYNGDQIICLTYDKRIAATKSLQDMIPSRISRPGRLLTSEITDIAVSSSKQAIVCYRVDRGQQVGVYLFDVSGDGRNWPYVKHLLLNQCWHATSNFTPRVEWCDKLQVFILVEYITGHLIMIAGDGNVPGECRFMNQENRRQPPLNLTISNNDWLCTRYESTINIQKIKPSSSH